MDVAQDGCGMGLVMDGVEDSDQFKGILNGEPRGIERHKTDVVKPKTAGLGATGDESFLEEVKAGERAGGERRRHEVDGVAGSAADVRNLDSRVQAVHAAGQRDDRVYQRRIMDRAAVRRPDLHESGVIRIAQAAAGPEFFYDLAGHFAHQSDVQERPGKVVHAGTADRGGNCRVQ